MCIETHTRHRPCCHTRFLSMRYCSVIVPSARFPTTGRACRRYKLKYKDVKEAESCFECAVRDVTQLKLDGVGRESESEKLTRLPSSSAERNIGEVRVKKDIGVRVEECEAEVEEKEEQGGIEAWEKVLLSSPSMANLPKTPWSTVTISHDTSVELSHDALDGDSVRIWTDPSASPASDRSVRPSASAPVGWDDDLPRHASPLRSVEVCAPGGYRPKVDEVEGRGLKRWVKGMLRHGRSF